MNPAPAAPPAPDGALLTPEPQEEVFRQTFDELNVPAVIAFLNRARRVRRTPTTKAGRLLPAT
jgi:hypothetical protein